MFAKLIVLAVAALTMVMANPMEDANIKKASECCPALVAAFKIQSMDTCKNTQCKGECLFNTLITTAADNKTSVNLAAVNTTIDTLTSLAWDAAALTAVKSSCIAKAKERSANAKGKCISGVRPVLACTLRSLAATCPTPVAGKCGMLMKKAKAGANKMPASLTKDVAGAGPTTTAASSTTTTAAA